MNSDNTIQNEIYKQLEIGSKFQIQDDLLNWFLTQSNCIYIFDGLDEIAVNNREVVTKQLHEFIDKHNNTEIIMTSRPEDIILSFGSFQQFQIKPLNNTESASLIRRYDQYSFKTIADELLVAIDSKGNEDIREFMQIPFLLSLIYKCFEYKKDIPLKKSLFYKQVYDALFDSHDLSKEGYYVRDKHSKLSLDDFDRVLRHIAYFSAQQNEVEYSNDKIIAYIDEAKLYIGDLQFQPSHFLQDLLQTVPLFRQDGLKIKWAHKSIQDYFAAKFIWLDSKEKQSGILKTIYKSKKLPRAINMLDLYEELDPQGFSLTILYWLLEDFIKHTESNNIKNTYTQEINDKLNGLLFSVRSVFFSTTYNSRSTNASPWDHALQKMEESNINLTVSYMLHIPIASNRKDSVLFACVHDHPQIEALLDLLTKKKSTLLYNEYHPSEPINVDHIFPYDTIITWDQVHKSSINDEELNWLLKNLSIIKTLNINECRKRFDELSIRRNKTLQNRLLNW